ncbi:MAG: pyridoxamine 5'-phosphate oxidase family protein [Labilithrix sp.]|nr:pyridoxamine 5'-phosphate oxidase family protein [Labilithrix sp.]
MGESTKQHLKELLESFDTAMLITRHGDRDHARPMAVAAIEGANTLWFATAQAAPKSEEIRRDGRVSATFQSSRRFVALSGTAELVEDRAKIHELWKPTWRVWFPEGKDDPKLVLIRVTVTDAEFWDNTGARGLRYAFEAARALLKRHEPVMVEGQHGRVKAAAEGAAPMSQRH